MKLLSAYLLLAVVLAQEEYESDQYNLYEQPSFLKDLYPGDIYEYGFCLETAEPAYEQGDFTYNLYRVVSECEHGQIDAHTVNDTTFIDIAPRFPAAVHDLGTLEDLYTSYGVSEVSRRDLFGSIHFQGDLPMPGLVLAKDATTFQPFRAADVASLQVTTQDPAIVQFTPIVGHVYLIRTSIGSTSTWDNTDFFYKLIPIGVEPEEVTLRWSVFYSATELELDEEEDEEEELEEDIDEAQDMAEAALIISIIALVLIVLDFCIRCCRWRKDREFEKYKPTSASTELPTREP